MYLTEVSGFDPIADGSQYDSHRPFQKQMNEYKADVLGWW